MRATTHPTTVAEAEALQDELRPRVLRDGPATHRLIAGLDVAYAKEGDGLAAAIVVLNADLDVVDSATAVGRSEFPYAPGLFAFREVPSLLKALNRLTTTPDLLVCDGHGIAHPRRFGLASHLGVLTDIPSTGVGKTRLIGEFEVPGVERGAWSPLVDGEEIVGRVVRTQTDVKPVFVSIGHRIDLDTACRTVLALSPRYRLPETTRRADHLCRRALAETSAAETNG